MTHKTKSWIKSALRIFGYVLLLTNVIPGIILLVVAEIIGIFEEAGQ